MNREFLKGLGIEDEQVEKIMSEHGKSVTKVKGELTDVQAEVDSLKTEISERDSQLDELSEKVKGNEALSEQIETMKQENERKLNEAKADALKSKKDALLAKSGYTDEQVERYRKFIEGETDEELAKAIEAFKADVPPKPSYVDPSPMNGERGKPEPVDSEEKGRNLFKRLRG